MIKEVFDKGFGYIKVVDGKIFYCDESSAVMIRNRLQNFLISGSDLLRKGPNGFYLIFLNDRTSRPNGLFQKESYHKFWEEIVLKYNLNVMMHSQSPKD